MTARPGIPQSSWNSGELSPELWRRTDIKQFYAGAALMRNVEPVPQGGFRLAPRSRFLSRCRTATANIAGQSFSLAPQPMAAAGVVGTVSLPGPQAVAALRLSAWNADQTIADGLVVEWQDPDTGSWHALAPAFDVGGVRYRVAAAPPGAPVTTTALRLRLVVTPPAPVTFSFGSVTALRETGAPTPARVRPFTFSDTQTYTLVFTAGIADVFRDGVYVGAVQHALGSGDIEFFVEQQRFDTMLLFRETVQTGRIMRQGADHEWDWQPVTFSNVPQVDLGGNYAHIVDSWQIYLRWTGGVGGLTIIVQVDGVDSVAVYHTGDWTLFMSNLLDAIMGLPSVGPGVTGSYGYDTASAIINVHFTGSANAGKEFVLVARTVNRTDTAATVAHTQVGKRGGESLISPSRGWPACGIFYQDRLVLGGFAARRSAFLFSVTGEYFDLNAEVRTPSGGILINLDTDGAERLQRFARGRHLLIFTSDAEYYVSDRAITRDQPINVVESSRNGSAPMVPIVASENALLYVAKNRSLVYSAAYSDISQNYESEPISLLASHLVQGIRDAALQRAEDEMDADRYFMVRDDGLVVVGLFIRNQEVVAFARWQTDGEVKSICVDGRNVPHIIVERMVGGQPARFLERFEAGLLLDSAVSQVFAEPTTTVDGLEVHEGATVWAICDGYVEGPFTVSEGAVELPHASSQVTIGRWTAPTLQSLPLPRDVAERLVIQRPVRVHTVRLSVIDTTSVAIGANGQPASDCSLYRGGDYVDAPPEPFTGEVVASGLVGWSDDGQVEITQIRPGRLQVRQLVVEAKR